MDESGADLTPIDIDTQIPRYQKFEYDAIQLRLDVLELPFWMPRHQILPSV